MHPWDKSVLPVHTSRGTIAGVTELTRRSFVTGGVAAGALAVGGAGVVSAQNLHGTRRFLHRHGIVSGPDLAPPTVDANVEYGTITAGTGPVNYGLYLPGGDAEAVLYCLHGRGGSRRDAFDSIGVHRFVAARKLPWAVASLDSGESFWHTRADGSDTQRDLLEVLMPFVKTKAPAARSAVIGWSMGGYGALLLAVEQPAAFVATVANGPSIWNTFSEATPGAFDDPDDFGKHSVLRDVRRFEGRAVRIDCGADDPFADAVRDLRRRAPSIGGGIHAGFHDDATWRSYLPAQLAFIDGALEE